MVVQEYRTAPHIVCREEVESRLEVRLDHKTSSQPFSDLSLQGSTSKGHRALKTVPPAMGPFTFKL